MSKNNTKGSQTKVSGSNENAGSKASKGFDKRLLLLLLLLPLGYIIWNFIPKGDKYDQTDNDVVEATLNAKNPLLQLLETS